MLDGRRLRHVTRVRGRPDGNRDDFEKLRRHGDVGIPDVAAELIRLHCVTCVPTRCTCERE